MSFLPHFRRPPPAPEEPKPTCRMISAKALSAADSHAVRARIAELGPWFHNFEIAKDTWTNPDGAGPGPDYPAQRWKHVQSWFSGFQDRRVLDVGCSSGFFSLKAKESGAQYVLGVDSGEQIRAIEQARFAAGTLGLSVEFDAISTYDLATLEQTFDTVVFMGVFYHLRHPLLALEAIRRVCTNSLIFQSITTPNAGYLKELPASDMGSVQLRSPVMTQDRFPAVRFIERSLGGDSSCWFVPNVEGVAAMLRSCGFIPQEFVFPDHSEVIVRCTVG